jgi:hypothetical protein
LTEWQLYAQKLEGDAWVGEKLDKSKLEKMSGGFYLYNPIFRVWSILTVSVLVSVDQQIGQLYELMQAIKNPDGEGKE